MTHCHAREQRPCRVCFKLLLHSPTNIVLGKCITVRGLGMWGAFSKIEAQNHTLRKTRLLHQICLEASKTSIQLEVHVNTFLTSIKSFLTCWMTEARLSRIPMMSSISSKPSSSASSIEIASFVRLDARIGCSDCIKCSASVFLFPSNVSVLNVKLKS